LIRFFWKYKFFNSIIILLSFILCILNFNSIKVFFDSERIIELANVERDIIDKSIDDSNLLLAGIELDKSLSFIEALKIASILTKLDSSNYIRSIRSVFNEQVLINQSIPIPIKLFHFDTQENFSNSLERIKKYESNFISSDFKSLIFVIKCKNLDSETEKIAILDYLHNQLSALSLKEINITGQIKSEIYMKKNIIKELILFISLSAIICSIVLFYFLRNYKLILVCLLSILLSITFSFSLSNIMFGGIELVMIIIPAIIFIINISDYMHLLNIQKDIKSRYRLFCTQLINIGKPVFLTSLTTAIGFLSFTFGSFEPLMRFGVVTTLSIFICLFVIVTFFALVVEFNILSKNTNVLKRNSIYYIISLFTPYKKWFLGFFLIFSCVGILKFEVDNYLTDELNHSSVLYQEINFIEQNFGGIKPLSFSLVNPLKDNIRDHINFLESNDVNIDLVFSKKDTTLIKTRIRDIGALRSNILYSNINEYSTQKNVNLIIGGVGYLFDKISNTITYEILIGLMLAVLLIGLIFVFINNLNFRYLFVSLIPNLLPLFSCLGIFSLFGFYISLSNAFIFAIVFGLIVDDSVHIISAYTVSRKRNKSITESIKYCHENTFHAVIKTTLVIIVSLIPLLLSEFTSISQLASVTITAALIALVFDILFLPYLLSKYIR
tara:strand:- start:1744 stop:3744 length:2001 start_codon:yes stop_codon:yes gene_type:complete